MKLKNTPSLLLIMMMMLSGCSMFTKTKVVNGNPYGFCPGSVHATPNDKTYLLSLEKAPDPYKPPQSFKNLIKHYADENGDIDKYCSIK